MDDLDDLIREMSTQGARPPQPQSLTTPPISATARNKEMPSPQKAVTADGRQNLNFSDLDDLMADLVGYEPSKASPLASPTPSHLPIPRQAHGKDRELLPSQTLKKTDGSGALPDSVTGRLPLAQPDNRVDALTSQMRDARVSRPLKPQVSELTLPDTGGLVDGPGSPGELSASLSWAQPSPAPTFGAPGTAVDALTQLLREQENITKRRSTMIKSPGAANPLAGGSRLSRDLGSLLPSYNTSAPPPATGSAVSNHNARSPTEIPSGTLPRAANAVPKPSSTSICPQCDLAVIGPSFTALGRIWHADCFVCRHCKKKLGSLTFFEHEGFPYCADDYHELFSPRCGYCAGVITDQCITALGKVWHADHFFCCQCGRLFGDGVFNEHEGRAYCEEDFQNMFAPKCGACQKPVVEENIQALGKDWHPHCFVCKDCKKPFANGSFLDFDNEPYCELHFHTRQGSLCGGCQRPIIGRCVTAIGKRFHPEHFTCQYCARQLSAIAFKQHQGKPYCQGCHVKLFG